MSSLKIPFTIQNGRVSKTDDLTAIVEQKIIDVLVTNTFERPMNPEYGVGVQSFLFDVIDELIEVDFKIDAIEEINSRVSGITVVDIRVSKTDDSEATITVYYKTNLSPIRSATLSLSQFNILTEESEL